MERLYHLQLRGLLSVLVVVLWLSAAADAARTCSSGNYFTVGTAANLQLTGDMSIMMRVRIGTVSAFQLLLGFYNNGGSFEGYGMRLNASGVPGYYSNGNGAWREASADVDNDTWRAIGVTITGTGAGAGTHWRDGATNGTFTQTAPTAYTGDLKRICAVGNNVSPFGGAVADVAIWDVGLTANEAVAYSQPGANVRAIRPANLVAYWPMWGIQSPEPDFGPSRYGATLIGSPTRTATHPPVGLFTMGE